MKLNKKQIILVIGILWIICSSTIFNLTPYIRNSFEQITKENPEDKNSIKLSNSIFDYSSKRNITWGSEFEDYGRAIAIDSYDNIYVVGYINNSADLDVILIKFNSKLEEQWNITWGGPTDDNGWGIAIDKDNFIYITGDTKNNETGYSDRFLIKFDTDGNLLWSKIWGGLYDDFGSNLKFDSSGYIYLGGSHVLPSDNSNWYLAKLDTSGNLIWERSFGTTAGDYGGAIAIDSLDNIYYTGSSWGFPGGTANVGLVKFNSSGVEQWRRNWGYNKYDSPRGIDIDDEDNIYVSASTESIGPGGLSVVLIKYNSSGGFQWDTLWGGGADDESRTVRVDTKGDIYVTGYTKSFGPGDSSLMLLKYFANGTFQGQDIWGGNKADEGWCIGWDSSDNLYITGYTESYGAGNKDILLLKYSRGIEMGILSPLNKGIFSFGENIEFTGTAIDAEGLVIPSTYFSWKSSIDGYIGNGSSISSGILSIGYHTITLTVFDNLGNERGEINSKSVNITVGPDFTIQGSMYVKEIDNNKYLSANITNLGANYNEEIIIRFEDENPDTDFNTILGEVILNEGLLNNEIKTVYVPFEPVLLHKYHTFIDPYKMITEASESNNKAEIGFGGNTPIIGEVKSRLVNRILEDNKIIFGNYVSWIPLVKDRISVSIKDVDGDVEKVIFNLGGEKHYGNFDGEYWWFEFYTGFLQPGNTSLTITAVDKLGYESKPLTVYLSAESFFKWIMDLFDLEPPPIGKTFDFNTSSSIRFEVGFVPEPYFSITFEYPNEDTESEPITGESGVPDNAGVVGGQSVDNEFTLYISVTYYFLSRDLEVEVKGGFEGEIFGYSVQVVINGTVTFDPEIVLSISAYIQVDIPLAQTGKVVIPYVHVDCGVALNVEINIYTVLKFWWGVFQITALSIITEVTLHGWLSASVDLGWVGGSFYGRIYGGIKFSILIENGLLDIGLVGKAGIQWSISWHFLWFGGSFGGRYEWSFAVFSPAETNETITITPWNFTESNNNLQDSRPRVATDHERLNSMMVWTKNRLVGDTYVSDICYSEWNGEDWGDEQYLTFDEQPDFDPTLTYDSNGNVMVLWSRVTGNVSDFTLDNPFDLLETQEIFYSLWNGSEWSNPMPITNDSQADGRAVVSAGINSDGEMLAVWVGDPDHNFTTTNDMELYYSVWNGTHWSEKTNLTYNNNMDYSVSLAYDSEGNAMACWVRDLDGNRSSIFDRELRYAIWDGNSWSDSSLITDIDEDFDTPSITYDLNNNALITWVGGNENISRLYFASRDKNTGLWSEPELVHEDGFFIFTPAINVDFNNTAVIVWRGFEDDEAERRYYLEHNASETYFDGEICYAVKDLTRIDANWSEVKYLTSNNVTDWMISAVIIRGHSNDLLVVWELVDDVASTLHEIKPDLTLNSEDITFSSNTPYNGEDITITARIHNIGDTEIFGINIAFYNGDPNNGGTLIESKNIVYLDYDSDEEVSISWTASPGIHNFYVIIDPIEQILEINESNNMAFKSISILPDLVISSENITFSPDMPQEGETITISAIIENKGMTYAENVNVSFFSNGIYLGSVIVSHIGVNDSAFAVLNYNVLSGYNNIKIVIDPLKEIPEQIENNNDASILIKVLPDFEVVNVILTESELIQGENVEITAEINNKGKATATNILVECYDGNPYIDGILIDTKFIDLAIGDTYIYSFNWIPPIGIYQIFVLVDGDLLIEETNEANNIFYNELAVRTQSDLSILESNITYEIGSIKINVPIINLGDSGATGIIIGLFDGNPELGLLLDSQMILHIAAGDTEHIILTLLRVPEHDSLYIVVDIYGDIMESDETNNEVIIDYSTIPKIEAGPDVIANEGDLIKFNPSYFLTGDIDEYTFIWDFNDGSTEVGINTTHQFSDNGEYKVILTVSGENYFGTDTLNVNVSNVAPIVDVGADQTIKEGEVVNFNGIFIDPGIADTHLIEWDFGDMSTESGILNPNHTYSQPGTYTVTLTVTDDDGGIGIDTCVITVLEVFIGNGLLVIDGNIYSGLAQIILSEDLIQIEIRGQIITWEVINHHEYKSYELIYGQGDLGRISLIIFRDDDLSHMLGIGNNILFFGNS